MLPLFLICKWYYLIFLEDKGKKTLCPIFHSLHHRHNLIQADYLCLRSSVKILILEALQSQNELPGERFEFTIKLIGQMNNGFSNNHDVYSNPGKQLGAQNRDFGACLQMELTRGRSFICGVCYISQLHTELTLMGCHGLVCKRG